MNNALTTRPSTSPSRGDVWMVNLNPTKGHEQAGYRPAVVVSVNQFNASAAGLVIVVPTTTTRKGIVWHVEVVPPEGNLSAVSYIKCEDVRSLSIERLIERRGAVSPQTMAAVSERLQILLGL